jgi:hypothetical protein
MSTAPARPWSETSFSNDDEGRNWVCVVLLIQPGFPGLSSNSFHSPPPPTLMLLLLLLRVAVEGVAIVMLIISQPSAASAPALPNPAWGGV